jgi:hypothetical protein
MSFKDLDWVIGEGLEHSGYRLYDIYVIGQVLTRPDGWPHDWNTESTDIIPLMYFDKEFNYIQELAPTYFRVRQYETAKIHRIHKPSPKELVEAKKKMDRKQIVKILQMFPEEVASRIAAFVV